MTMMSSYDNGLLKFPLGIEVEVAEDAGTYSEPECYHEHDEWCYTHDCWHECDEYCEENGCDHECDEDCYYLSCDHADGYCDCEQVPRRPEDVDGWEIVPDSSCGWEYVSEIIETEGQLNRLIDDLFSYGDVITNEYCGVHIHVGNLGVSHVWNLARLWEQVEGAFLDFADTWGNRLQYCYTWEDVDPVPYGTSASVTYEMLQRWWYGSTTTDRHEYRYDPSRYHTLNLHSWFYRGTVEFRLFNGTEYKAELEDYVASVRFLIEVVDLLTEGTLDLQEAVIAVKEALAEHRFDLSVLNEWAKEKEEKEVVGAA